MPGACESFNPNAGTRAAEETKTNKYKLLCEQRGVDFVPIVFTASGGMGEQFQRRYWNPHWIRVAEEDEANTVFSKVVAVPVYGEYKKSSQKSSRSWSISGHF